MTSPAEYHLSIAPLHLRCHGSGPCKKGAGPRAAGKGPCPVPPQRPPQDLSLRASLQANGSGLLGMDDETCQPPEAGLLKIHTTMILSTFIF